MASGSAVRLVLTGVGVWSSALTAAAQNPGVPGVDHPTPWHLIEPVNYTPKEEAAQRAGGDQPDGKAGAVQTTDAAPQPETGRTEGRVLNCTLPPPAWKVSFEPRLWWTSPSGELKLPAASGTGPGAFADSGDTVEVGQLNLDTPRLAPSGEVHIAAERWRFAFSGAAYSLDRDNTPADSAFRIGAVELSPGEPMAVRFEYSTFEVNAGYEAFSWDFAAACAKPENAIDVTMRLIALGGVRLHDVSFEVSSLADGTSTGTDQLFIEPLGGVRAEFDIFQDFSFDLQVTGGAWIESDRSVYSVDMVVAFRWRPTPRVGLEFGWRQMLYSLSDGEDASEFEYVGGMAGVFTGVVVRF